MPAAPGGAPGFFPTGEQVRRFQADGYLVVRDLFSREEVSLLSRISRRGDASAGIWVRNPRREAQRASIFDAIYHDRRVVEPMSALLGDEVTAFNYKMITKQKSVVSEARNEGGTGNHWVWHQDWGYWYHASRHWAFPDMGNCWIAVDRAHRGNGCLQVLRGSHKLGRLEHGWVSEDADGGVRFTDPGPPTYDARSGGQYGADPARVRRAVEQGMETVSLDMEPGSAVFWHANLLHRSDTNASDEPRWAFICCYNVRGNTAGRPGHRPVEPWPAARVAEIGAAQLAAVAAGRLTLDSVGRPRSAL